MTNWPFIPLERNLYIAKADGVYLTTSDGKKILDASGGAIVSNVGHGRAEVAEAVGRATARVSYVVPPWLTEERVALVDRLRRDWLPSSLTRIHLVSGGSEGAESAMKIAIKYHAARNQPEKCKIVGRSISYHGTTLATAAVGGHAARKEGLAHALPSYPSTLAPYPLRCPVDDPHAYYVDAFRQTIAREGADTIAALIAEPITGTSGGAIVPPDGYWEDVRRLCADNDILLIMDEVMTGFGRTGADFGFQHWPIEPDILIAGKGLGGGYAPITGVFATEQIGAAIEDAGLSVMFHTFGAHPAACAAADVVLDIMQREKLVQRSREQGQKLQDRLLSAFADHPHVAEVRGRGLLQAIEIVKDRETLECFDLDQRLTDRVMGEGISRGVIFYGGGTGVVRDIICMGPAFIIEDAELDFMVDTLVESVDSALAKVK